MIKKNIENPIFSMPKDERMKLVTQLLNKLQEDALDIKFFETEESFKERKKYAK